MAASIRSGGPYNQKEGHLRNFLRILFGLGLSLILTVVQAQDIKINEIVAKNTRIIQDSDGDYPDWIELYNPTDSTVDLFGYGLSDLESTPFRWTLPGIDLPPFSFLMIFASDKDRFNLIYWDQHIGPEDLWNYTEGKSSIPANWFEPDYRDSGWDTGPGGFGYGDDDDETEIRATSIFIRKRFDIENLASVSTAMFCVDFDDGFIAYLNGQEIARENMGNPGESMLFNRLATNLHEAQLYQGASPSRYLIEDIQSLLYETENVLAIQVHNASSGSSDLSMIPYFLLGRTASNHVKNHPPEILGLRDIALHTNFKIKSSGETLYLSSPDSIPVDSVNLPYVPVNVSYGRLPDGSDNWKLLAEPTPGAANAPPLFTPFAPSPVFSHPGGFTDPIQVTVGLDSGTANIFYTLDGSEPTENTLLYTQPIRITKTTVLRARAFIDGYEPGFITTATYFIRTDHKLPIVSLVTDPPNLWDWETGIYVAGPNAQSSMPHYGANYWEEWEKPVHVEFFEPDGTPGFHLDAGMKIMGGWSRARDQKSLAIFARSEYGTGEIDYQIFPDKPIQSFEAVTLRNSGNDWDSAFMRDGFMQTLLVGCMDLELMAYRPAAAYINGEYWGILNLREKQNEHYLASNTGVDPDNIDLLEGEGRGEWQTIQGSHEAYQELIQYLEQYGAEQQEDYDYVVSQMDVENFIEYQIAQIYFDNQDWPGNNIKFWQPRDAGGRWRWLTFDTDFGFGIYDARAYQNNTLDFALEPSGPGWPNPPWSTFLLRSLVENETFRELFINRFADHLNTTFNPDRVIDILYSLTDVIEDEIPAHRQRWPGSAGSWNSQINRMETFAEERVSRMFDFIEAQFDLSSPVELTLSVSDSRHGYVRINHIKPDRYPWTGYYFPEIPIQVKAVPQPGYRFVRWSDGHEGVIRYTRLRNRTSWKAEFEASTTVPTQIVFSEINYNATGGYDTKDWLELYNGSEQSIDLSGWIFQDEDTSHGFVFPPETVIEPSNFLVLCQSEIDFRRYQKRVSNVVGDISFNLGNGGDILKLIDPGGVLIDSVYYDDQDPWPPEADGQGRTLELRDPNADNSDASVWSASALTGGTPGRENSTSTYTIQQQVYPVRMQLLPNYPNPFNPATQIPYDLSKPGDVSLRILNIRGRVIRSLVSGESTAGSYTAIWDGRDTYGMAVSSGIYFVTLEIHAANQVSRFTQKMILMR